MLFSRGFWDAYEDIGGKGWVKHVAQRHPRFEARKRLDIHSSGSHRSSQLISHATIRKHLTHAGILLPSDYPPPPQYQPSILPTPGLDIAVWIEHDGRGYTLALVDNPYLTTITSAPLHSILSPRPPEGPTCLNKDNKTIPLNAYLGSSGNRRVPWVRLVLVYPLSCRALSRLFLSFLFSLRFVLSLQTQRLSSRVKGRAEMSGNDEKLEWISAQPSWHAKSGYASPLRARVSSPPSPESFSIAQLQVRKHLGNLHEVVWDGRGEQKGEVRHGQPFCQEWRE
ncbi:hypothetical protein Hypma_014637 [Hypsizygus marmoreus]|uniref:Uncharacterized protein n=1 Tax=Hypsizygus marmoreus TaxID=39966 RepID=A0A369J9A9_HYPMA|nr:hypothetical protein Hypma_014637 [Hypsizygus marmoreus]